MRKIEVPTDEQLKRIPELRARKAELEKVLEQAKTARTELRSIHKEFRDILRGPVKKRARKTPKPAPELPPNGANLVSA